MKTLSVFLLLSLFLLQCTNDKSSTLSPVHTGIDSIFNMSKEMTFENPDSSKTMLEHLLSASEYRLNKEQECKIYTQLGIIYSIKKELDKSDSLYQKAINALKGEDHPCLLSSVYINCGINQSKRGSYIQSIDFYKKAEAIIEKQEDKCDNSLDRIYNNMGISYQNSGMSDSARYFYEKVFSSAKENGNKLMMANSLVNISIILHRFEEYEQVKGNLTEAIQLFEDINNKNGALNAYMHLAIAHSAMNDFDKALSLLESAESTANELNLPGRLSAIYQNMGEVYFKKEDYAKSLIYVEKSLDIKTQYKDSLGIVHALSALSSIHIKTGKYNNAKEAAIKALNINHSNEHKNVRIDLYNNLSEALINLGEKDQALDIISKKEALRDSVFSKQKVDIVQEWQVKYDTVRKEEEIKRLNERNEAHQKIVWLYISIIILSIMVALLSVFWMRNHKKKFERQMEQLKYRTIKSKFIPHFTGNVLNSINYLIAKDVDVAQQYIAEFSAFTSQSLYNSDKFYQTLKNELEYAETYLKLEKLRFEDRLSYTIDVSPEVNTDMQIPTMIIHTLCENALKHGIRHKNNGKITISAYSKDYYTVVAVEDNGIGREKAKDMNTEGSREGLKIVNQQIALLNKKNKKKSTLKISDLFNEDNTPAGTRFELWL